MMQITEVTSMGMLLGAALLCLSGCPRQEGPAERIGKELDQAVEKTGKQIEKAGERVQDAAQGDAKSDKP